MKKLLTFLTLLTLSIGVGWAGTVTETITNSFTGVSGTSYTNWSNSFTNGVSYSGNSASNKDGDYIQLRSNNSNSGIVSTTSIGTIKKVVVTWNSSTTNGRTLDIYGKNSAYSLPSDLYDDNAGTKIGSIVKGTSTELTVSGSYAYIGLRSNYGAMYINQIVITWEVGGSTVETVATPTFSPAEGTYTEAQNVTISCTTSGATIHYTTDGATPTTSSPTYSSAIPVSETKTIKAIAVKSGMNNSDVATATYTINIPQPSTSTVYERVTSLSASDVGKEFVFVCENKTAAMGTIGTYGTSISVANLTNGTLTVTNEAVVPFTLGGSADAWTFENDDSYISWNSGNGLSTASSVSANSQWKISFSGNNATISNGSDNSRKLQYNASSPRFACYTSSQTAIQLYKKVESTPQSSDVYIIGQVNGNDWDASEGLKMTYSSNNDNYIADIYCTGVNNGDDEGYSFFLFAKSLPYDWNNTSNLYGSGGNGSYWGIGGNNESAFGEEIPLYEGSKDSFRLAAGLYTVTVDLDYTGHQYTTKSVKVTKRDVTMTINGSQYFEDTRDVTMTSNLTDIGGKIYYTTDGSNPSDPNSTRQEYTGAITISQTTTFKAVAFIGNLYSDIVEKTFTKTPKTPVISPESCTFSEPLTVTITCETAGATIRYTLDGTNPTSTSTEYTGPLTISETTTVKARAFVGDTYSNGIATAEYVYTEPYVPGEGDFVRVTSKDDLVAGREYIIVTADYNWAMGAISTDDKRAAAASKDFDFDISTDHSTVTLTENSTVNVMKLEDGRVYPSDDTKYWNLKQENGQYVYLNNSGTQISQSAQTYLSGYSKELIINITAGTNENNYAIITEGGNSQILYSKGPNNTAGYFRYYSNTNQNNSAYSRVFLYYREGATVPPTEATLAVIESAQGVKDTKYAIADDYLVAVEYRDVTIDGVNYGYVWCKDNKNIANPITVADGVIDFMSQGNNAPQQGEWDQSNWVVLRFKGDDAISTGLKGHKVTDIVGTYIDDINYMIDVESYTKGEAISYTPNVYCVANFNPNNWGANGVQQPNAAANAPYYFFMTPKVQEVCEITYAEWNGTTFTVPESSGFAKNTLTLGWDYNEDNSNPMGEDDVQEALEDYIGTSYKFIGVVQRSSSKGAIDGGSVVYPMNLTGGEENDVPTAINGVVVNGEVKSVKYVNVAGIVSDVPFQGVNIVVTEYTDGTRTTSKMLKR